MQPLFRSQVRNDATNNVAKECDIHCNATSRTILPSDYLINTVGQIIAIFSLKRDLSLNYDHVTPKSHKITLLVLGQVTNRCDL